MRVTGLAFLLAVCASSSAHAEYAEISNERIGAWEVRQLEDQIEGTKRWMAVADSGDKKGAIVFKCDGGTYTGVYVGIFFEEYMGGDEDRELTWRVDKAEPVKEQWRYDKRFAYLLDEDDAWRVTKAIRDGTVFRARGISYDYDSSDVIINIGGARDALKKVYQGCGDKHWAD